LLPCVLVHVSTPLAPAGSHAPQVGVKWGSAPQIAPKSGGQ
jgi:hypothetical protein